ncbi:MAG TPA: T9SS type A sorting domain-containing protein [Flavobacteriales bacterium]
MRKNILPASLVAAVGLLTGSASVQAQNITGYRYWFDDNVPAATVVTVAATPVLDTELVLDAAALAPGHHTATVQFRDADGHWSAPWTSLFVQSSSIINGIEYWFDDQAGSAVTADVTPAVDPLITAPLDAGALPVGFHTVTMRTIDGRGVAGVPYTTTFTRNGGAINGYEYWLDDNIAERTTNSIGPDGTVDLIANLPVPTNDGDHHITIRFRDEEGGWSVPLSSAFSFIIGVDELPGISNYLLFPNPVNDQLSLRLEAQGDRQLDLTVFDATGRQVESLGNWGVNGTVHRSWDVTQLAPGRYLLRIQAEGRSFQIPFVKQ